MNKKAVIPRTCSRCGFRFTLATCRFFSVAAVALGFFLGRFPAPRFVVGERVFFNLLDSAWLEGETDDRGCEEDFPGHHVGRPRTSVVIALSDQRFIERTPCASTFDGGRGVCVRTCAVGT